MLISYFKEFKNREKRIKIQFFLLIKEKRINFLCGVCLNFDNFFFIMEHLLSKVYIVI